MSPMINNKLFNKSNKIKEGIILNISKSLPFNKPKLKLIKTPFNISNEKQFQIQQKLLYFITKTIPKNFFLDQPKVIHFLSKYSKENQQSQTSIKSLKNIIKNIILY